MGLLSHCEVSQRTGVPLAMGAWFIREQCYAPMNV
jgi:hypothetical protein